jgi:hypothetical protein
VADTKKLVVERPDHDAAGLEQLHELTHIDRLSLSTHVDAVVLAIALNLSSVHQPTRAFIKAAKVRAAQT